MSFLDKVGKAAMDAVGKATDAADKVQKRIDPLIDKSPLARKLRDRVAPRDDDDAPIPEPESNASPFEGPEPEPERKPLGDASVPAQVFGPATDPWTGRTRQLLNDHDIEHGFVDLESEDGLKIEPRLHNETKQSNPPYVYLRGEFIGGYNALNEIVRLGQLEEMTMTAEERDKSGKRTRIVISKRTEDDRPPGEGN